jgi:ATP-dependent Clp protease ATP-binding subunit ClpA
MDVVRATSGRSSSTGSTRSSCSTGCKREHMGAIVDIQLGCGCEAAGGSQDRARARQGGARWLADKGYDPAYGARPLKRVIQRACRTRSPA